MCISYCLGRYPNVLCTVQTRCTLGGGGGIYMYMYTALSIMWIGQLPVACLDLVHSDLVQCVCVCVRVCKCVGARVCVCAYTCMILHDMKCVNMCVHARFRRSAAPSTLHHHRQNFGRAASISIQQRLPHLLTWPKFAYQESNGVHCINDAQCSTASERVCAIHISRDLLLFFFVLGCKRTECTGQGYLCVEERICSHSLPSTGPCSSNDPMHSPMH